MSLQDFISTHRGELIRRTRAKVATRPSPQPSEAESTHGVPLFLSQLARALEDEVGAIARGGLEDPDGNRRTNESIAETARSHGQDLRKLGFSVEQVVHDYGDVCQAVTELAIEHDATVTTAEFHTLNRCLDNAIAGAVTSWNDERERSGGYGQLDSFKQELLGHLDAAIAAFEVIRAGRVGAGGATAVVVERSLGKMLLLLREPKRTA
jgi:hypothetical protein